MDYFLIDDLDVIKRKLNNAQGYLNEYYRDVLENGKDTTKKYNWNSMFCYLISGEEVYGEISKKSLINFVRELPEREKYREGQIDHWVGALPVARMLIYYDWVKMYEGFTVNEQKEIELGMLRYLYRDIYQALKLKPETLGDNQTASLVISSLIMGYLLGYKIGNHPVAVYIFKYALDRLPSLIGHFPRSGYSGEGSTYMNEVAAPAFALLSNVLEYITDNDYLEDKFAPHGTRIKDILKMNFYCMTPSGYTLPWDHYGYGEVKQKCAGVFYAQKYNPEDVNFVSTFECWQSQKVMWGFDDQVLSLLWWPAEYEEKKLVFESWCQPQVGGGLTGENNEIYYFQMWDKCAGGNPVRQQANPNSMVLEYKGVPLFMDGTPTEACQRFNSPATEYKNKDLLAYNYGYGTLAGHNCIIIDDEEFYYPQQGVAGSGNINIENSDKKIVSGDVSLFYQDYSDCKSVVRSAVMVEDKFLLIKDEINFEKEHKYTWRAFLRGDVDITDNGFSANIEGINIGIIPLNYDNLLLEEIEGYPREFEQKSTLIKIEQTASQGQFFTLIYPSAKQENELISVGQTEDNVIIKIGNKKYEVAKNFSDRVNINEQNAEKKEQLIEKININLDNEFENYQFEYKVDECFYYLHKQENLYQNVKSYIKSGDWEVRMAAAEVLGIAREKKAAEALLAEFLKEKNHDTSGIYEKYNWMGTKKAAPDIDVKCWRLKSILCRVMGQLQVEEAIPYLKEIIKGNDYSGVCTNAVYALGQYDSDFSNIFEDVIQNGGYCPAQEAKLQQ
ncbi:MAG: HEAT repeat domain-containing protein [Bacillota bacterium]